MNEDEAAGARRFDPKRLFESRFAGHGATLGIDYHDHGSDWAELALPYAEKLIGDPASGVIASGPILALMDMATSVAVWLKVGMFLPHATLDLRIDYLRPAKPGGTVIGRGECYRITRSVAFVRGQAHDGDPGDPVANVAATFMAAESYR
ncbi:PaaI family thioesterase [Sphingomonas sp. S2-65]|uniref:PaaI family thioesterase n=1 Tax=Sphingomonas sp. S2-65 TaxID=2903960 RepID=UPI001F22FE10|nr:PaaI family thioesterase [Sphingomonas sp. S2-65]UYY56895.1 PaaI family thioesterase [Sphingomonas sp. S2-65]